MPRTRNAHCHSRCCKERAGRGDAGLAGSRLTAHAPHFHKAVRPKRPRASPSRMSRHGWCDVLLDPPATPASTFSASSQHQDGRSPSAQHLHSLNLHRCLGTVQRPSLKSWNRPKDLVHLRMPVPSLLIATHNSSVQKTLRCLLALLLSFNITVLPHQHPSNVEHPAKRRTADLILSPGRAQRLHSSGT
jgi:hypothetical protein